MPLPNRWVIDSGDSRSDERGRPFRGGFFVPGRRRGVRGGVRPGESGVPGGNSGCRVSGVPVGGVRDGRERRAVAGRCDDGRCGERPRRTIPNVREKGGSRGCRSVSAGRTERREEVGSPDGDGSDEGGTAIAGRTMAAMTEAGWRDCGADDGCDEGGETEVRGAGLGPESSERGFRLLDCVRRCRP